MKSTHSVEEWRTVPGYEGRYEASSSGRVRSLGRHRPMAGYHPGRILKPNTNPDGYQIVILYDGQRRTTWRVHRLVMLTFVGEVPPEMEVRHLDGNPGNNELDNLAYGTSSENKLDIVRHGRNNRSCRTHCPRGHLLTEPNLVRSETSRRNRAPGRDCLACSRTRAHMQKRPEDRARFVEVADRKYERIVSGR